MKIETWTKRKNKAVIITFFCFALPEAISFLYGYYFNDSPDEYYHLPVTCHVRFNLFICNDRITGKKNSISRYPFDWESPVGYIVAIIFQTVIVSITSMNAFSAVLFPVAHYVFLIAFCSDLQNKLRTLNKIIESRCGKNKKRPTNRHIEIKKQIFKTIQFQCEAKQLSE